MSPYREPAGKYEEPDTRLPLREWLRALFKSIPSGWRVFFAFGNVMFLICATMVCSVAFSWFRMFMGWVLLAALTSPVWLFLGYIAWWAWRNKNSLRLRRR